MHLRQLGFRLSASVAMCALASAAAELHLTDINIASSHDVTRITLKVDGKLKFPMSWATTEKMYWDLKGVKSSVKPVYRVLDGRIATIRLGDHGTYLRVAIDFAAPVHHQESQADDSAPLVVEIRGPFGPVSTTRPPATPEKLAKAEPRHETARKAEPKQETARKAEPQPETARKPEPRQENPAPSKVSSVAELLDNLRSEPIRTPATEPPNVASPQPPLPSDDPNSVEVRPSGQPAVEESSIEISPAISLRPLPDSTEQLSEVLKKAEGWIAFGSPGDSTYASHLFQAPDWRPVELPFGVVSLEQYFVFRIDQPYRFVEEIRRARGIGSGLVPYIALPRAFRVGVIAQIRRQAAQWGRAGRVTAVAFAFSPASPGGVDIQRIWMAR